MLDRLLGRAALREEIFALERALATCREERDRLEAQLDAEDERRRDAVRDRQLAQERINRLEDRIEQLEADLDRAGAAVEPVARGVDRVSHRRMAGLLEMLDSTETGREEAYTAMIGDRIPEAVEAHFGERTGIIAGLGPCLVAFDTSGIVEVALEPPLAPDPFETWADGFDLATEWFRPADRFVLAVVRSDRFALGRFDGADLLDVEGFSSEVMGRHSKGGFSQARFERRREEQIARHLDRCRERLAAIDADTSLYLTGARDVLDRLDVAADATAAVDASGSPADAIEGAFEEFWTTVVHRP